jgi:7-cyano-7-deazaguanine synthase in queuosine biosynthesis
LPPFALSHSDSRKFPDCIRKLIQVMESMMPACMQNPTPAQNNYDSSENRLKRGV